jgi:hypothetical protein
MLHFFDMLHFRILDEGIVALAVRVSDDRVDEYLFELGTFREMADAFDELPAETSGPEGLRIRVDTENRLVSLAIAVGPTKREVYRIGQSQFEAMLASFRASDQGN